MTWWYNRINDYNYSCASNIVTKYCDTSMNKRDSFLNKHMLNPYCSLPHRGDNDDLLALVRSLSGRHYKYQLQSVEAFKFSNLHWLFTCNRIKFWSLILTPAPLSALTAIIILWLAYASCSENTFYRGFSYLISMLLVFSNTYQCVLVNI